MKLYFLLEDQKSFMKVLPSWLEKCLPEYKQVYTTDDLSDGSYLIESGYGYPNIKNVLKDIKNITKNGTSIEIANNTRTKYKNIFLNKNFFQN